MKLKIAYFISFFPALSETYLLNQLSVLIAEGHDVTIFSKGKPENYTKHAIIDEFNMLHKTVYRPLIPRSKFKRAFYVLVLLFKHYKHTWHLLHTLNFIKYGKYSLSLEFFYDTIPFLNQKHFDIVHCHFGPNAIMALNFREIGLLKGRLITSFHGYDVNHKEFLSWKYHYSRKGLYKDLVKECQCYTVNSLYTRDKALRLGIPAKYITYLPVGLDTEKFKVASKKERLTSKHPIILTVARLTPFKGLKYSIEAAALLVKHHPDLEYHILGEGEQRNELEELIKRLQVSRHVFIHGATTQEKVLEYYTKADVFVLAGVEAENGEIEAQGLVVQEAQCMELPVVVTDAGGIPEGMLPNLSGYVVQQRDINALAEKIDSLLKNPDTRKQMGKAGRAFAAEHFSSKMLHQKLMALYYKLIQIN